MPRLTGLSPQREQQLQERLLLRMSRKYEGRYRSEIRRAMTDIAEGELAGRIGAADETHRENMRAILLREYSEAFDLFGGRILDAAGKCYHRWERKFDEVPITEEFDRRRQAWIATWVGEKITQVTNTTHEQVMRIVREVQAQAVEQGLGEAATAKLLGDAIRESGGLLSASRSRTISRTEGHAASSAANREAAKATGIVKQKEWVASNSERTREDHSMADGQRVNLDDMFEVGGESLMEPGDPAGSPELIINCRCVSIFHTD